MAKNSTDSDESMAIQSYISSLGDELLVEILCRLGSSKYATQCKCICKRWFSLINSTNSRDSYFLHRWRKINQEDEAEKSIALLTQYRLWSDDSKLYENHHCIDYLSLQNKNLPTFKFLDFLPCCTRNNISTVSVQQIETATINPIFILATSKDLVLCSPKENDHNVYYVCNPFTKQWIILPPSNLPIGYIFNSSRVSLLVSYDDDGDLKFKVVHLLDTVEEGYASGHDMVKVETFSSDDSSCTWRVRDISVPVYWSIREVVYYDGMLVWRNNCIELERIILFPDDHACANTDANYTLLPLPVGYEKWTSRLGVSMGCLRIGQLANNNSNLENYVPKLNIWELDRHSQDWKLVHELDFCEVDLPNLPRNEYLEKLTILAFHPRDRDILYLECVSNDTSMTCICNIRERTVEVIRDIPRMDWSTTEVFPLQMSSWPTPISLPSLPPEREKSTLTDLDEPGSKFALVETSN